METQLFWYFVLNKLRYSLPKESHLFEKIEIENKIKLKQDIRQRTSNDWLIFCFFFSIQISISRYFKIPIGLLMPFNRFPVGFVMI
jgi:hypothetical protein